MTLSGPRLRLLVTALLVVSFLGALDHTIVSTSLATMAGSLGALEQMSWVVVAYTLAATVLLPVLGKLGDLVGPRRVFLASLVLFLLASAACGFAQDMAQLVAARVVQGMSSAGLQLMSQTIVALVASPRQRPRLLSIIGAAFPIAILVGPILGGAITDSLGWQWVFWINLPFCLVALVLALVAIPEVHGGGGRRRVDVAGAVLFTGAMIALVLAVTWVGHPGSATAALVAAALAVAGFALFFVVEVRAPEPIVPLRLFRNRSVAAGIALSAIIGIGLFSVVSYIPTYIQMAYRTTATVSGLVPIATVFGMLVSNLLTGWLSSRTGHYRGFAIAGTSLATAGLLAMAFLPIELPLWAPMAIMAVVGIGTGAFMSLVLAIVQGAAPRADTGAVTATTNLVRQVGATLGTAVIGGILGAGLAGALPAFLDPSTLTPEVARQATLEVQVQISEIYRAVLGPVFAALAATYALGIVAAVLLPAGRLADESPVPAATQSQPA
ncbi:MAG: MFS transporter [Actinomycetota bacterium]|nr:MFS transporter [Actinomycetota bacterium]